MWKKNVGPETIVNECDGLERRKHNLNDWFLGQNRGLCRDSGFKKIERES